MNCQNCGAPMRLLLEKHHFVCDYCTSVYYPEETEDGVRILEQASPTPCPVCRIPLVEASIQDSMVLYCKRCRGILMRQPVFLDVIRSLRSKSANPVAPPPFRPDELRRQINCPQCNRKMDTHPYGGPGNIVIDNCPHCLLNWLDYKEITRISRSPDRAITESSKRTDKMKLFRSRITGEDEWREE